MKLKVLSYNIRGLPWIECPIDSILFWSFMKSEPDFICLQEVFTSKLMKKVIEVCHQFGYEAHFPEVPYTYCQRFSRFQNPSGLCTLIKRDFHVYDEPVFEAFLGNSGVDTFVTKGFFVVEVVKNNKKI
jgi:exonuclease III